MLVTFRQHRASQPAVDNFTVARLESLAAAKVPPGLARSLRRVIQTDLVLSRDCPNRRPFTSAATPESRWPEMRHIAARRLRPVRPDALVKRHTVAAACLHVRRLTPNRGTSKARRTPS